MHEALLSQYNTETAPGCRTRSGKLWHKQALLPFFRELISKTWKKISWKICKATFPHQNLLPFSFLYWTYLALVQDTFRFGHADYRPSHFAMCLECPGEDRRGFLRRLTKASQKKNCWKSPLLISTGEAQHWLQPRRSITHATSPTLFQASARRKMGFFHLICKHHGKWHKPRE